MVVSNSIVQSGDIPLFFGMLPSSVLMVVVAGCPNISIHPLANKPTTFFLIITNQFDPKLLKL